MPLHDRTFLLLGATGGIGQALIKPLLKTGVRLIVGLRDVGRETSATHLLERVRIDLAAPDLDQQLAAVSSQYPAIDGVIHCAGQNTFASIEATTMADIDQMLAVNLRSPMALSRHFVPRFRTMGRGTLMFVGSTFGSIGFPGYSVYSATKFGLRGFSEALRREVSDSSLEVLYLAPRATRTDMNTAEVDALNDALGNTTDAPEQVAAQILKALTHTRRRTYLGWPEKLFVHLNGVLPRLVDAALRKQLPIIRRFLDQRG
ncbi:SDR family oxidoreductase [Marinobacter caseinilyticus]|uniref:SDR family oxidoreductase n=1 Tax=Marinobacter caseinilyticus TaxID=2692195 RepID=UPI001408CE8C|nr:SDR family oxidoreductase [Marinobacter caseinilyticus]